MTRLLFAAALLPLAQLVSATPLPTLTTSGPIAEANVAASNVVVESSIAPEAKATPQKGSLCLPGEVVKCTLGPPPVCHCELPRALHRGVAGLLDVCKIPRILE